MTPLKRPDGGVPFLGSLVDDAMAWQHKVVTDRRSPVAVEPSKAPVDSPPPVRLRVAQAAPAAALLIVCVIAIAIVWVLGAVLASESSHMTVMPLGPAAGPASRVLPAPADRPLVPGVLPATRHGRAEGESITTSRAAATPVTLPPGRSEM